MVEVVFVSTVFMPTGSVMGCERHPVEPEIRFLDGRVERFIRFPLTRWQRLTEWDALLVAAVLALFFAVIMAHL
jgi:hypothetical protein